MVILALMAATKLNARRIRQVSCGDTPYHRKPDYFCKSVLASHFITLQLVSVVPPAPLLRDTPESRNSPLIIRKRLVPNFNLDN